MNFSELCHHLAPLDRGGEARGECTGVTHDSRQVGPGMVFVALRGEQVDGHAFVGDAVQRGAAALVLEEPPTDGSGVAWLTLRDTRAALPLVARLVYDDPSAAIELVGITGTNGKTTTTYLLESVFAAAGRPAGVLGTINVRFGAEVATAGLTTPEASDVQRHLAWMRARGARAAVMEVSSHALELHRVDGCQFAVAVLTNLTRDHLDFHGTLERYQAAKARLFHEHLAQSARRRGAVVNLDDAFGRELAERAPRPCLGFALQPVAGAAVFPLSAHIGLDGISAAVQTPRGVVTLRSPLAGPHNLANILTAVAVAELLDVPHAALAAGIAACQAVPGRLERVADAGRLPVFVDYAHTDDALRNVTTALRPHVQGRLITVFGCGGDRDRTKRPAMGRVALEHSDLVVVTSDNPRTEDPLAIVADILPGLVAAGGRQRPLADLRDTADRGVYAVEPDREAAIRGAIAAAAPGDVVLIAGKGHEDYQIVGRTKRHFDDREVAAAALRARATALSGHDRDHA